MERERQKSKVTKRGIVKLYAKGVKERECAREGQRKRVRR